MSMPSNQAVASPNQSQTSQPNPTVATSVHQLLAQGFTSQQIIEELRRVEYAKLAQEQATLSAKLQNLQAEYNATGQKLNEVNQQLHSLQTQQTEDTNFLNTFNASLVPSATVPS